MTVPRTPLTHAALGRTPVAATRLRGGRNKGVYRLTFDDGSTVIAYAWSATEGYWEVGSSDLRDPFSHGTGLDLVVASPGRAWRPCWPVTRAREPRPCVGSPSC